MMVSAGTSVDTDPEIRDIKVYDVTGLSSQNWRTGGELTASGVNTTLTLDSEQNNRLYRFLFEVENNGSETWALESNDILYHDGLNSTWQLEDVWYNTSETYQGGQILDSRLDWDTTGGKIGTLPGNDTLFAQYVVNTTHNRTLDYQQEFRATDYSEANSTQDQHRIRLLKYGDLKADIQEPSENSVVTRNRLFDVNASFRCVGGSCGNIEATARYNQTGLKPIPSSTGTPFYAETNPKYCDGYMGFNQTCKTSFRVNATGELESVHKIDVIGSSNLTSVQNTSTGNRTLEINSAVYIDLSWETVDFGLLDPGEQQVPAEGNSDLSYNVTVGEYSQDPSALWIKSAGLDGPLGYSIAPGNITYGTVSNYGDSDPLSSNYQLLEQNPVAGTSYSTFYWLNTPTGLYNGDYTGTLTVKANATEN